MAASSPEPPLNTFVLRFWREWSVAGPRWRGQIDHVQSGTSARFLDLGELTEILQSFGVMTGRARQADDIVLRETVPRAECVTGSESEALADRDRAQHEEDAAE